VTNTNASRSFTLFLILALTLGANGGLMPLKAALRPVLRGTMIYLEKDVAESLQRHGHRNEAGWRKCFECTPLFATPYEVADWTIVRDHACPECSETDESHNRLVQVPIDVERLLITWQADEESAETPCDVFSTRRLWQWLGPELTAEAKGLAYPNEIPSDPEQEVA
jgi:hypothetical protein